MQLDAGNRVALLLRKTGPAEAARRCYLNGLERSSIKIAHAVACVQVEPWLPEFFGHSTRIS